MTLHSELQKIMLRYENEAKTLSSEERRKSREDIFEEIKEQASSPVPESPLGQVEKMEASTVNP